MSTRDPEVQRRSCSPKETQKSKEDPDLSSQQASNSANELCIIVEEDWRDLEAVRSVFTYIQRESHISASLF